MKKSLSQKVLTYTAIFEPADEGGYVVSVPSLPGCHTQGETFEEAVAMIQDAISGYLSVLHDEKQEIPKERKDIVVTKVSIMNPPSYI